MKFLSIVYQINYQLPIPLNCHAVTDIVGKYLRIQKYVPSVSEKKSF